MTTTGKWSIKSRLDHLVNYIFNSLKTVTQYAINKEKMMEKRYVTYINCSFDNPKDSMEKQGNIIMMKVIYLHFMVISLLKKMKSMRIIRRIDCSKNMG
ncbi:hypothetical protein [Thomasclavelia ramosa]|uniref:hypothetical protein n=1 Tax=Thomasclavelia ramosa TaxID=1547 RepID=UPI0022E2F6DC|nr:hypothetical protein [Thomasclavelia ramosa]